MSFVTVQVPYYLAMILNNYIVYLHELKSHKNIEDNIT